MHHVEFGVRNGEEFVRKFTKQYKFELAATRKTAHLRQWVLKSGIATVLLTQQDSSGACDVQDKYCVGWLPVNYKEDSRGFSCQIDSVFNVALKVKSLMQVLDKFSRSGVSILKPATKLSDKFGSISFAVVKSCVGNVVHTLIDDSNYKGIFLPDFEADKNFSGSSELVSHFDHVTFACACGDSGRILDWYAHHFGMRRFLINR